MVSRVNELMLEEPRGYTNSSGVLYAARNMVFTGKGKTANLVNQAVTEIFSGQDG